MSVLPPCMHGYYECAVPLEAGRSWIPWNWRYTDSCELSSLVWTKLESSERAAGGLITFAPSLLLDWDILKNGAFVFSLKNWLQCFHKSENKENDKSATESLSMLPKLSSQLDLSNELVLATSGFLGFFPFLLLVLNVSSASRGWVLCRSKVFTKREGRMKKKVQYHHICKTCWNDKFKRNISLAKCVVNLNCSLLKK